MQDDIGGYFGATARSALVTGIGRTGIAGLQMSCPHTSLCQYDLLNTDSFTSEWLLENTCLCPPDLLACRQLTHEQLPDPG